MWWRMTRLSRPQWSAHLLVPQLSATYLTIDDVNATVDANNENILADRYNVEFLGDGSCLIYARDGIDVGTHDENVDDVTSSIHLGVCAHNDCDDDVFIAWVSV